MQFGHWFATNCHDCFSYWHTWQDCSLCKNVVLAQATITNIPRPDVVVQACNPSTEAAEAGEWGERRQPRPHSEFEPRLSFTERPPSQKTNTYTHHVLGGLNNIYFSRFWRLGCPSSRCQQIWYRGRAVFLLCPPMVESKEKASSCVFW
jgi:hypothetical protein